MNKAIIGTFFAAAVGLSACSQPEETKPVAPVPVATVAVVSTPAPPPAATGDLMKVKANLTSALTEVKNKNYTGAVALLDSSHKELTAAAANAPAATKAGLEKAGTTLETVKGLVEKKDAGAEKGLRGLLATVTKLADTAKMADGAKAGAAKGAAEKAMPAKK